MLALAPRLGARRVERRPSLPRAWRGQGEGYMGIGARGRFGSFNRGDLRGVFVLMAAVSVAALVVGTGTVDAQQAGSYNGVQPRTPISVRLIQPRRLTRCIRVDGRGLSRRAGCGHWDSRCPTSRVL